MERRTEIEGVIHRHSAFVENSGLSSRSDDQSCILREESANSIGHEGLAGARHAEYQLAELTTTLEGITCTKEEQALLQVQALRKVENSIRSWSGRILRLTK